MNEAFSKTTLARGPAMERERQTVSQANNHKFFASWRQKFAAGSGRARHVADSADAGQLGHEPDTAGRNELDANKPSLPHRIRSMVASVSSRKNGKLAPSSPRPNASVPHESTDTAAPPAEPAVPPSPVTPFTSPASDVDDVPVASAPSECQADAYPLPAQIIPPAFSPSIHPTFAAFLEEAALLERSRAIAQETETDYTGPVPSLSGRSTPCSSISAPSTASRVSSSSWGGCPPVDCGHPECVRAEIRIREMHRLRRAFAKAGLAYHPAMRDVYRALRTAYRLL